MQVHGTQAFFHGARSYHSEVGQPNVRPMNRLLNVRILLLITTVSGTSCVPADANRTSRLNAAFLSVVAAEDARPTGGPALVRLHVLADSDSRFIRAAAVRALGRLENPDVADRIELALSDPAPEVRAEAANALAQAYFGANGSDALDPLLEQAEVEHDLTARAAVAASLGRLALDPVDAERASDALIEMSYAHGTDAPGELMEGVALGIDALSRSTGAGVVHGRLARRLDELRLYADGTVTRQHQARVRALALNVLGSAGLLDRERMRIALRDDGVVVKAAGVRWIAMLSPDQQGDALRQAMFSRSVPAQIEGLRFIVSQPRTATTCEYLMSGARTPPPDVVLPVGLRVLSIDGLAQACPDLIAQREVLSTAAAPDQLDSIEWQPPSHALVALAQIAPSAAGNILPEHVGHSNPFVRSYAARAAGIIGDRSVLRTLLTDTAPNVRTEALLGLTRLDGRAADRAAIEQLTIVDPQLVMTASATLAGSREPDAGAALTDALDRMSEERRETFRDARRALLDRLAELGGSELSERLIPYLSDYDALVAQDAARVLEAWNGRPYFSTPIPPESSALPTVEDLEQMVRSIVVLHMQGGGEIHIALHPYAATTNTWRFFRQARNGDFNGLTFHRWAPNFVIQGGSPNANEYYGDGPFSRDEVGMHHWRGSVGISTRGHDTGDGQIFVNLLDNTRLDHQYTVIGMVTDGLDVVDEVNEGGMIQRTEVRPTR